jgi:hypothetical protein
MATVSEDRTGVADSHLDMRVWHRVCPVRVKGQDNISILQQTSFEKFLRGRGTIGSVVPHHNEAQGYIRVV